MYIFRYYQQWPITIDIDGQESTFQAVVPMPDYDILLEGGEGW